MAQKMTVRFPRRTSWRNFSGRLVAYYGLPHGSRFDLVYHGHPVYPNDRKARDDMMVWRRPIVRNEHPTPRDGSITIGVIRNRIEAMLQLDLRAKHLRVVGVGPGNAKLDARRTLATWRRMEAELTEAERNAEAEQQWEIEHLVRPFARATIIDIEEGLLDPEGKVPQGVLAELVALYGPRPVQDAIQELRL